MTQDTSAGDTPPGEPEAGAEPSPQSGQSVTEGGYEYTVVGEEAPKRRMPGMPWRRIRLPLAIGVIAVAAAAAGWFGAQALGEDDSGDARTNADVASVINAFSQGQDSSGNVERYEGELPQGFPDGVPSYPGAEVLSSLAQESGEDVGYLVVYDTRDDRDDVAAYFTDAFDADPWQTNGGQDSDESTIRQFARIDDSDVSGLVLVAESKDRDVTTIVLSVQVVSGAGGAEAEPFEPGVSRVLPDGFPSDVPQYPDSIVIESAFQREPRTQSYAVALITADAASDVMEFYRTHFQGLGWTVDDGDASRSSLEDAEAIVFASEEQVDGGVVVGRFAEDANYTRVEIQVSTAQ